MNQFKMYRCIKLLELLQKDSRHLNTIARYLNVTERTVYRYLEMFRSLEYKIIKDKNNKIRIEKL